MMQISASALSIQAKPPKFSGKTDVSELLPWHGQHRSQLQLLFADMPRTLERPSLFKARVLTPLEGLIKAVHQTFLNEGYRNTDRIHQSLMIPILQNIKSNMTIPDRDELVSLLAASPSQCAQTVAMLALDLVSPQRKAALLNAPVNLTTSSFLMGNAQITLCPTQDPKLGELWERYKLDNMGVMLLRFRRESASPEAKNLRQAWMKLLK